MCRLITPNPGIEALVVALHWLAKFKDSLPLVSRCGFLRAGGLLLRLLLVMMRSPYRVFRDYLILAGDHYSFILLANDCHPSGLLLLTIVAEFVRDGLLRHWTVSREGHTCSFIGKFAKDGIIREWHIVCLALRLSLNWATCTMTICIGS